MPDRLRPTHQQLNADRSVRLTDFATGKTELRPEHVDWLNETLPMLNFPRQFHIFIFGYASKLGFHDTKDEEQNLQRNTTLSFARANEVVRFLEHRSPRVSTRVSRFQAVGNQEAGYNAANTDNSPEERAVEVHVFFDVPPAPPPHVLPEQPCPGGHRFVRWSIAVPGGASFSPIPGTTVAGNIVVFRKDEPPVITHSFVVPGSGPGFSFSIPGGGKILKFFKDLFGKFSVSGLSFTSFGADVPFNFGDLDGADCLIASAGGGIGGRSSS
jgi:hypothetical protein